MRSTGFLGLKETQFLFVYVKTHCENLTMIVFIGELDWVNSGNLILKPESLIIVIKKQNPKFRLR